jgi:hypothetical protein
MESTTIGRDRQRPVSAGARPAGTRPRERAATPLRDGRTAAPPRPRTRPAAAPAAPSRVRRPATAPAPVTPRPLRRAARVPRAPFVLLVLSLLGGGLICLLVINTTLGATSFEIDHLQQSAHTKALQVQQLQNQLQSYESDAKIEQEACQLGMRPQQQLEFLDLSTHRLRSSSTVAASPAWCPKSPGATAPRRVSSRSASPQATR